MSFVDQLRALYVQEQPYSNLPYDTNLIFANVYSTVRSECTRRASGYPATAAPAVTWKGAWNSLTIYNPGDGVDDLGVQYVCILTNSNIQPPNALYWTTYVLPVTNFTLDVTATVAAVSAITVLPRPEQGGDVVTWRGVWNSNIEYVINDGITFNGTSYVCVSPNLNLPPPNPSWLVPAPNSPLYPYLPQTGTYVATNADLLVIRAALIKKLTADGLVVTSSGPININISWA